MANCLDTCSGTCSIDGKANVTCSTAVTSTASTQTSKHGIDEGTVENGGVCYADDPQSGSFDCAGNLSCQNGFCRTDYTCDAPCGQQSGGVQSGGQCAYNADCADAADGTQYSCLDGTCKPDEGTVTEGGVCEIYANGDDNCAGKLACISGICQVDATQSSGLSGSSASGVTTGTTGTTNTTSSGSGINTSYVQGYTDSIKGIINNLLVPLLIAVAFIVFLWGVLNYFFLGADDPKKHEEGRTFIIYGIIGFVVIFAVWGIVNILLSTLSLTAGGKAPITPTL